MSLSKNIKQNFLWRGLYLVSVFVINLLLARILGADTSGSFYLLLNNLALLVLVAGLCIESAIVYFGSSSQIDLPGLFGFSILWSLIVSMAVWLIIHLTYERFASLPINSFWLAAYVCAFLLINNCTAVFQALQNFSIYNIVLLACNFALIVYLLAVYFFNLNVAAIAEANAIAASFLAVYAQGLLLVFFAWRRWQFRWLKFPSPGLLRKLWRYAFQALITNIVFFLVYRVDYWFLNYFRPADDLGNYIQVSKLVQLFMLVPTLLATTIFPATAQQSVSNIRNSLASLGRVLFSGYLLILTVLAATGTWLFPWLFGPDFTGMYQPFLFLIPGIMALALHSLLTSYYAGIDKVRINLAGASIALGIILCLDAVLIPSFGSTGAAIASSAGYLAYAVFMFYRFQSDFGVAFTKFLFINGKDWKWIKTQLHQFKH